MGSELKTISSYGIIATGEQVWAPFSLPALNVNKALSSYRTLSRYLRDCALGKAIKIVPGIDALVSELRRIGNNLNQLARAVNSGYAGSVVNLTETQEGVKGIWQSLNSLSRDAR